MNTSSAALLALRAFRSGNNSSWTISRTYASTTKPIQVAAKPTAGGGGSASGGSIEGKLAEPPANVFKQVDKSALGPGASKESNYKNPEYFSYHNMSYTEMEIVMAKHRVPQPSNKK